jgi:hypothetical protein
MQFLNKIESFIEKYRWFLIGIGIAEAIFLTAFFLQFAIDDSWITYRYAKNLVEHGIWNWNPDRANPTEAYTSFIYAFLAILPTLIKIEPSIFFKLFGLAIFFALIYRMKKHAACDVAFILGFYATVFSFYFFVHLYSGLETPLFIFLIFETMLVLSDKGEVNEKYLYILLLLLPLTRPEGIIYSIGAFFFLLIKNGLKIKNKLFLLSVIFAGAFYMAWRVLYFGQIFPNPYYVKNIYSAAKALNAFARSLPLLIVLLFFAALLRDNVFTLFTVLSLAIFSFVYAPSQLLMNFADRFRFQIFFPLMLFFAISLKQKYRLLLVPLFLFCFWPMYGNIRYFSWLKYYGPVLNRAYKELGVRLAQFKDRHYTFLVGDAGVLPYYSEWKCYDPIGLADKEVARRGLSQQYLEKIRPDLISLYSRTPDKRGVFKDYDQEKVLDYIQHHREYEKIGGIRPFDYYLIFFLKRTVPDYNDIKFQVQEHEKTFFLLRIDLKDLLLQKYLF